MEDLETLAKNPPPPHPRLELLLDDLETLAKSNPLPPKPRLGGLCIEDWCADIVSLLIVERMWNPRKIK